MKKVFIFSIISLIVGYIFSLHITQMRLKAKADEYKKSIIEVQRNNDELTKKRDKLKKADYDTVREEATRLGLIKKEEKVIRFYK